MAHMIMQNDQMVYAGETPWHGLGKRLPGDAMTSEDALHLAGLDWEVQLFPVQVGGLISGEHFAVCKMHDDAPEKILGTVGGYYTPLQNREAFKWFDSIVGEGQAIYHTAGSLFNQKTIWMLAKLPDSIILPGDDRIDNFLLLTNNHTGKAPVMVTFTPVRVVCYNTLSAALKGSSDLITIRHTLSLEKGMQTAKELLGLSKKVTEETAEVYDIMSGRILSSKDVDAYFKYVVPNETTRSNNIRKEMIEKFEHGVGAELISAAGTLWGAYNAVTEYISWDRGQDRTRLESSWFGSGADLRQKAWDGAKEMLRGNM